VIRASPLRTWVDAANDIAAVIAAVPLGARVTKPLGTSVSQPEPEMRKYPPPEGRVPAPV